MMPKHSLTSRQAEILEFIQEYIEIHGYAPSVRNIGSAFFMAANAAVGHLKALERKGWITREKGMARTICVISSRRDSV